MVFAGRRGVGTSSAQICAGRWAAYNEQGSGASSYRAKANVSFEGEVFYSYSTAIARYVTTKAGSKVVLMLDEKLSPTTSQHQSYAESARHAPLFKVDDIGLGTGWKRSMSFKMEDVHAHNVAVMCRKLGEYSDYLVKMWRRYGNDGHDWHDAHDDRWPFGVRARQDSVERYARAFGTELDLKPVEDLIGWIWEQRQAKRDRYYDPAAVRRRERQVARRAAEKALGCG